MSWSVHIISCIWFWFLRSASSFVCRTFQMSSPLCYCSVIPWDTTWIELVYFSSLWTKWWAFQDLRLSNGYCACTFSWTVIDVKIFFEVVKKADTNHLLCGYLIKACNQKSRKLQTKKERGLETLRLERVLCLFLLLKKIEMYGRITTMLIPNLSVT